MTQNFIKVSKSKSENIVDIVSPQKGGISSEKQFKTKWTKDLLDALVELKGEWFLDSYQRFEHPNYVQKQIDFILSYYGISLSGKKILDFGCGFGASTYCLLRRGATNITMTELDVENLKFGSIFLKNMGYEKNINVNYGDMIPTLEEESYDIIWLQAVAEHLLPDERAEYFKIFWRTLKSKGLLIVTEVPNRHWPIEVHTTGGTWFLPWKKPDQIFHQMRKSKEYSNFTNIDFYRSGIVGLTYSEILDLLGNPDNCIQLALCRSDYFKQLYAAAANKSSLKAITVSFLTLLEPALQKVFRQPMTGFMPFLNHLAFQKV